MHYLLLYFKLGLQEQNTFKIDLIDTSSSCMQEKKCFDERSDKQRCHG